MYANRVLYYVNATKQHGDRDNQLS